MAPEFTYANDYERGQCTWYVAGRRRIPNGWGNADNWYYAASADGWRTGPTPAVGAIATTSAGAFGHVALVEHISADYTQVYVSEMNYVGTGIKSYRWAAATSFRYIY
jgi:surface antigen